MLKVNVGLSRKLSENYNSTGFSINVEGEVTAAIDDAEAVIEGVKELYDLAEEALDRQVERHQGDSALASHDQEPARRSINGRGGEQPKNGSNGRGHREPAARSNGRGREPEPATTKQVNYLLTLGKQHRLATMQLEQRIEEVLGHSVGIYDLTKREAAQVIDELTSTEGTRSRR